ncbi:unnamed protein product [Polarella glacialis]|uniref:Uncharacterized protein n=1 Tax=Polarella glacialis TaxID=89957 RepID=A0A813HC76_POLGL|nr:unnamed protein product [Polarella glacialis]
MSAPSEDVWGAWDFLQRMDWAAREVSLHGRHITNWALGFHLGRWVLQNILFACIAWLLPIADVGFEERVWCNVVRYSIFSHALESCGWRHGPMCGGRVTPWPLGWFTNLHYRFTRGTFRYTGNKFVQRLMGSRRTVVDIMSNAFFLLSSLIAVLFPQLLPGATVAAAAGAVWVWIIDQPHSTDGKGTTHVHFILAGCLSASQGGVACGQLQILIIWIASGLCKQGPWMAFVTSPLLGGSVWCRGRIWMWRLLYRGDDDLRPTCFADVFGRYASHVEWLCPIMLLFPCHPALIYCSLALLVAMHVYIMATAGLDVLSWNGFFIVAGLCLFGGGASFGFDYDGLRRAPWPLLIWYMLEIIVIIYGWFYPGSVSFQAGHRNWAGNEPVALVLLRRDAARKLTQSLPIFGRPMWDPVPDELRSWYPKAAVVPHLGEMTAFKIIATYWLGLLNMKILPMLVLQALQGHSIGDFYVMNHMQFWDMLWGSFFFCPTHMPDIFQAMQEIVGFEKGECLCVWVTGFPVAGAAFGGAAWQILDAHAGLLAEGQVSIKSALSLASLPSACARADPLIAGCASPTGDNKM